MGDPEERNSASSIEASQNRPLISGVERRLRQGDPPVVARIENERLLVDLRTVLPEEEPLLVKALLGACR